MNNLHVEFGSTLLSTGQKQERLSRMLRGRSKKGHKVSGNRQKKCGYRLWPPNHAARLPCNEERQLGKNSKKVIGVDPRKNARSLRESSERGNWTFGHCAGNSEEQHRLLAAGHCASRRNGRSHFVVRLPTMQQFPLEHCIWWCAVCGGKYEWRAPNRILVVQLGTNATEAMVFRTHAAPQRLCEHLINPLKLLVNQQTDGDSPFQSIVTGLHERTRKGIMDGIRSFIEEDKHSALDVGHWRKGLRPCHVQKPNFSEDYPEPLREGAHGLTLRAEEVKTPKACVNNDHSEENRCGPPLVDAAPQIPNRSLGQSPEVFGESVSKLIVGSRLFVQLAVSGLWPRGLRHGAKDVGHTDVGRCLAPFGPVGQRAASTHQNVPGKYGPHGELFFLPHTEGTNRWWLRTRCCQNPVSLRKRIRRAR